MVAVGDELFAVEFPVRRQDLVAYAEASGDHNPIHLDDDAARAAGLPGVIAHGMFTMGLAARAIADWAGGPDRVTEFSARFAKPVPVPPEGTAVTVSATVRNLRDDATAELAVTVTCGTDRVLAPSRAVVAVPD